VSAKCQASCGIPPATSGINQHSPLDRLTLHHPPPKKKTPKNWINKELKTNTQQTGWGAVSIPEKGEQQGADLHANFSKQRLERQKGQQWAGDKPLPKIGQVEVHKAHLLSQWATSKVKWHCKIEKQSANHHNTLTAGGRLTHHWPFPEKWGEAKKQGPSKLTQWKPNSKAGWLVSHRADFWNLRTTYKLKLPHLTEGGAN
jgi:hypothetical protein